MIQMWEKSTILTIFLNNCHQETDFPGHCYPNLFKSGSILLIFILYPFFFHLYHIDYPTMSNSWAFYWINCSIEKVYKIIYTCKLCFRVSTTINPIYGRDTIVDIYPVFQFQIEISSSRVFVIFTLLPVMLPFMSALYKCHKDIEQNQKVIFYT